MKNINKQNQDNYKEKREAQLRCSLNQSVVYTYYDVNSL